MPSRKASVPAPLPVFSRSRRPPCAAGSAGLASIPATYMSASCAPVIRTWCVDPRPPLASMPKSSSVIAVNASQTSVARSFLESRMTFDKPSSPTASPAASPGPLASAREPGRADRLYRASQLDCAPLTRQHLSPRSGGWPVALGTLPIPPKTWLCNSTGGAPSTTSSGRTTACAKKSTHPAVGSVTDPEHPRRPPA